MADPRALITVLLLLFILFSPSPSPEQASPSARTHHDSVLALERAHLGVLQNSSYTSFDPSTAQYLNITGFSNTSDFAWAGLGKIKERARVLSTYALGVDGVGLLDGPDRAIPGHGWEDDGRDEGVKNRDRKGGAQVPLYKNVSGVVHGGWVRSKVPESEGWKAPRLNMSEFEMDGPFGPVAVGRQGFGRNVSEEVKSGWVRLLFQEVDDPETLLVKRLGFGAEDDDGSDVGKGKVDRKERGVLREIRANIKIGSEDMGDDFEAQVYGVHYLETGNIVLTTTSEKFAGIFALPHLTVSDYHYGLAQELLNRSLSATIRDQEEGRIHGFNPWSSASEGQVENSFAPPNCELVVYLQQQPVHLPADVLPQIESELRHPTGAFPPSPHDLHFTMLAFSPDCGYVLESRGPPDYVPQEGDHLTGPKVEMEYVSARRHILLYSLVLFAQLLLLIRQMRDASTPSTRSRISFYTVAMIAWGDGFTTMTLCLCSLFTPAIWVPLIGAAFLSFVSVSFFGMRFLLDIYTVLAPERERAERARREAAEAAWAAAAPEREAARVRREAALAALQAARARLNAELANSTAAPSTGVPAAPPAAAVPALPPSATPIITAAGADTFPVAAPPPVNLTPRAPPPPIDTGADVFIPSDQDITQPISPPPAPIPGNDILPTTNPAAQTTPPAPPARTSGFASLYTRFYFLLLATLFLSLNASSWPPVARRIYFTILSLSYLSFWLPQINRNIQRNCRRALRWDFVIGQSLLRLVPVFYFYGYTNNVLFADVDWVGLAVLAAWVWLQVLLLISQEVLGPRWCLPERWSRDWVPLAYDYHPVLSEDEEGGNLPIGATEAFASTTASPSSPSSRRKSFTGDGGDKDVSSGNGKRMFDCAICMGDLEVPVFKGGVRAIGQVGGAALLLERRRYMVTPCRHIFHSGCLEGWMKYRLQCPVCREELPPV